MRIRACVVVAVAGCGGGAPGGLDAATDSDAVIASDAELEPAHFETRVLGDVGTGPWALRAADLDEDGRQDLAVVASGDRRVVVLLARPEPGAFRIAGAFDVGAGPRSLDVADLDGDGHLDLAIGNTTDRTISILRGSGNGTFDGAQLIDVGDGVAWLALAELDGDGVLDLAATLPDRDQVATFHGNGDATFTADRRFAVGDGPLQIQAIDLDTDGRAELVVTNQGDNAEGAVNGTVSILRRDGGGFSSRAFAVGGTPRTVAIADFDADGRLDLAVPNYFPSVVTIHLATAGGGFELGQVIDMGRVPGETWGNHPFSVATADFDRDGRPDLAVSTVENALVTQLAGRGDGTFQLVRTIAVGDTPIQLIATDLDRDRFRDLAIANLRSDSLSLVLDPGGS